jgi:hypothetical protein
MGAIRGSVSPPDAVCNGRNEYNKNFSHSTPGMTRAISGKHSAGGSYQQIIFLPSDSSEKSGQKFGAFPLHECRF